MPRTTAAVLTDQLLHGLDEVVRRPLDQQVEGYDQMDRQLRSVLDGQQPVSSANPRARGASDGTP